MKTMNLRYDFISIGREELEQFQKTMNGTNRTAPLI